MKAAQVKVEHAKQRAEERYGLHLEKHEYNRLVNKIRRNQTRCIKRCSNTRTIHEVDGMIAVYSNKFHKIITFLPVDCKEVHAQTD